MGTTVDNRVVEMRFDNSHFEKNVSTTMSTLDKLKRKLNLSGASKGLDDVGKAAKNVDMSGMAKSIDVVHAKFSALQVAGITALVNITNQAINAGKKIVSALTIDPIKTGFSEYETKMGSIQTIMSNTASKGTTMADVTRVIDELNTYADKTIYNFAEMTRNIGTFTAAGVGLEESASAIKGIANLAAASGSTSQQASTAMYQLSQALAAGTVKLMDWNSVVNAGMGGEKFQLALKETAREMGIAVDEIIEKEGSFRESLKSGWMSAEVLNTTLNKFTVDGARNYAESMMAIGEYTNEQAEALIKEAQAMEDAATKVKTFSQLWDTLKEAAQSGWGKTWELIIGDFEKAKERLTRLSDIFGGIIDKMSDARNNFLESSLSSGYDVITRKINALGLSTDKFQQRIKKLSKISDAEWDSMIKDCGSFEKALRSLLKTGKLDSKVVKNAIKDLINGFSDATESTKKMTRTAEEYEDVINRVIRGDFGNGEERFNKLAEAGYNWAKVQNMINEQCGISKRYNEELAESQIKNIEVMEVLTEEQIQNAESLAELSDETLKAKGYTNEQIQALRFLSNEAKMAGRSIDDMVDSMAKPSGSELIWDTIMNIITAIGELFKPIQEAWNETFDGADGNVFYGFLERLNELSKNLIISGKSAENFKKIFEGLFAAQEVGSWWITGTLTTGLKLLRAVLGLFGTDILSVTAALFNYLTVFRDWVFEHTIFIGALNKIALLIYSVINGLQGCVDAFLGLEPVRHLLKTITDLIIKLFGSLDNTFEGVGIEGFVKKLDDMFSKLHAWIKSLNNSEAFIKGIQIIEGLIIGIEYGIESVIRTITNIANLIITTFADILGIHSPSRVFYDFGVWLVEGLINGVVSMINAVLQTIKVLTDSIIKGYGNVRFDLIPDGIKNTVSEAYDFLQSFKWEKILSAIPIAAAVYAVKKIYDLASILAGGMKKFNSVLDGMKSVLSGFADIETAFAQNIKAKSLKHIAISIAILVGSVIALTLVDTDKLYGALGVIAALSVILIGLAYAIQKLEKTSVELNKENKSLKLDGLKSGLVAIATTMLLIAAAVRIIGTMDIKEAIQGFTGIAILTGVLATVFYSYGKLIKGQAAKNMDKAGSMLQKFAVSLLLMVAVCKLAGMLSTEEMLKGAAFMAAFTIFTKKLMSITTGPGGKHCSKAAKLVRSISISILLMIGVCKLAGSLSVREIGIGAGFLVGFGIFLQYMIDIVRIEKGTEFAKLGFMLLSITTSLFLLVGVCKLIGMLVYDDIVKGILFVGAFTLLVKNLVNATKIGPQEQMAKVGLTILSFAMAMTLLAGVCILTSMLTPEQLVKGLAVISVFGLVISYMIKATKGASDVGKSITAMVGVIVALSVVVTLLAAQPKEKLAQATIALATIFLMFSILAKSLLSIKDVKISSLLTLSLLVAVLGAVVFGLSFIKKPENAIKSSIALSTLLISVGIVAKLLTKYDSDFKSAFKGAISLTSLIIPLLAFTVVIKQLDGVKSSIGGVTALIVLTTAMAFLLEPLSKIGKRAVEAVLGAVALSTMAVPLLIFISLLKQMDGVKMAYGTVCGLVLLMGALTLMLVPLTVVGKFGYFAAAGILALSAMAIPMLLFIKLIKKMDNIKHAERNVLMITTLITALASVLVTVSIIAPLAIIAVAAINQLVATIVVFGLLVTNLGYLNSKLRNMEKFIDSGIDIMVKLAGGIGEMLGAFVGKFGETVSDSMVKIGDNIAIFMESLAEASTHASGIKKGSFKGVKQLIDVMGEIAAMCVETSFADIFTSFFTDISGDPSSSMKKFEDDGVALIKAIGKISETSMGITVNSVKLQHVIDAAESLLKLQDKIEPIGIMATLFKSGDDLGSFGANVCDFFTSIKTALASIKGFAYDRIALELILSACDGLVSLQSKLEPIKGITSLFKGFTDLETFAADVSGFLAHIKLALSSLDEFEFSDSSSESLDRIIDASTKLSEVQKGLEPIRGIKHCFTGFDDLGSFAKNVALFITNMKVAFPPSNDPFIIDENSLNSVVLAGEKLSELQKSLEPIGGVISWFVKTKDLGKFGSGVKKFGEGIGKLKEGMGEDGVDATLVETVVHAGNALAELQKALPEEGFFDGKLDLSQFSVHISNFASAMKRFNESLTDLQTENIDTAIQTAYRIKYFTDSLTNIDTSGLAIFTGIGTGGIGADGILSDLAESIADFCRKIYNVKPDMLAASTDFVFKIKDFSQSMIGVDFSGLETFKIENVGKEINKYYSNVSSIDPNILLTSISAARQLKYFIDDLVGFDPSGVDSFRSAVNTLSNTSMQVFVESFNTSTGELINLGARLIDTLIGGMILGSRKMPIAIMNIFTGITATFTLFDGTLYPVGMALINGLIEGVNSGKKSCEQAVVALFSSIKQSVITQSGTMKQSGLSMIYYLSSGIRSGHNSCLSAMSEILSSINKLVNQHKAIFMSGGTVLISKLIDGITKKSRDVYKAVSKSVSGACDGISEHYRSFKQNGKYLGDGLVEGINDKADDVYNAAFKLGQQAVKGEKDGQHSCSPSKDTIKAGHWLGEGLVIGMKDMASKVYAMGHTLGDKTTSTISKVLGDTSTLLDGDIDVQPRIAPVLDLDNIKSGAGMISKLLNGDHSIGVSANVGQISRLMNKQIQNGGNDNVVSAINKLRKDLGNVNNNTYNINGVTYDDGSNVSNAVEALIGAIRVERRS